MSELTGIEALWHQVETVRKVLKQFRGRVLLADEVGVAKPNHLYIPATTSLYSLRVNINGAAYPR